MLYISCQLLTHALVIIITHLEGITNDKYLSEAMKECIDGITLNIKHYLSYYKLQFLGIKNKEVRAYRTDPVQGSESEELGAATRLDDDVNFYQNVDAKVAKLFHINSDAKLPSLVLLKKDAEKVTHHDIDGGISGGFLPYACQFIS
ncbi:PDI-like 1-3 [Artemisia annua]|uniref:PDI-like 1-3 n=1 Tax=Artemisia annua TaxID=35608 RepID=A0A2U1L0F6_ARTAN|nr:PDI-like 1-3 [Artemisia annua]